jgi:hypothetical protein
VEAGPGGTAYTAENNPRIWDSSTGCGVSLELWPEIHICILCGLGEFEAT